MTAQPAPDDEPTICGACGGINGQHWRRCPDRDIETEPEQPAGSNTPTASHRRLMALRRW